MKFSERPVVKKIVSFLDAVFGWGIAVVLFAGGLTSVGFVVALCIGGETATALCTFLHKTVFNWIISAGSVLVLLGLVRMYLSGTHSLKLDRKKQKKKNGTDALEL